MTHFSGSGGFPERRIPGTHLPAEAYTGPIEWPSEDPDNPSSRFALMTRTLEGLHRYDPPARPRHAATEDFRGWMQPPPEGKEQSPTDPRM